ncbi:hypothetical protein GD605_17730 [Desulfolutivibrio sulfoxidireducens]|nr:hypothetical protein GD605_17730 [Desulfolutivibrio sulfoxidireducens]
MVASPRPAPLAISRIVAPLNPFSIMASTADRIIWSRFSRFRSSLIFMNHPLTITAINLDQILWILYVAIFLKWQAFSWSIRIEKQSWWTGEAGRGLMRRIKAVFDPHGAMNPGKAY